MLTDAYVIFKRCLRDACVQDAYSMNTECLQIAYGFLNNAYAIIPQCIRMLTW